MSVLFFLETVESAIFGGQIQKRKHEKNLHIKIKHVIIIVAVLSI